MPIYKPTELRQFLEELGIAPKKGLSQNFLIDGNIIRKIVAAAKVEPGDIVLEIGPGPGSLTQALLETGAHVIAVEKDQVLAKALERLRRPSDSLQIFCDDIMTFPLEAHLPVGSKVKVIANLPYHLTTPIIAELITKRELFSSLTLMVQDEVARRFTAIPHTKEYGSFTVFLEFYSKPKYAFFVSHHCFYPEPKVDSAVVVLDLQQPPLSETNIDHFFRLTRTAFEHRRKMLRSSLRELYDPLKISAVLESIGQNPLARPEDLSLQDFLRLYDQLHP